MDKLDREILYILDKNSRASFTQIAKELKQSKETIRYRFNNLVKNKVIKFFLTYINPKILGYFHYELFIKTKNLNSEKKNFLIEKLKNEKNINWLAELEGSFDLGIIFTIRSSLELEKFTDDFKKKYSKFIMKQEVSINLSTVFLHRNYLIRESRRKNVSNMPFYLSNSQLVKLDDIDQEICFLLSKNSRLNSVEIAQKIGKSSDLVLTRMKKLKDLGVITGFSIYLNHKNIGLFHYKLLLKLGGENKSLKDRLIPSLRANLNCIAIVNVLGNWDLEVDFEVEDISKLRNIVLDLNDEFSEVIVDYQTLRIVDVCKMALIV